MTRIDRSVIGVALLCAVLLVVPWFLIKDIPSVALALIAFALVPSLVVGHFLLLLQARARTVRVTPASLLALLSVLFGAYLLFAFGWSFDEALASTDRSTQPMAIGIMALVGAIGFGASGLAALFASAAGAQAGTLGRVHVALAGLALACGAVGVWLGLGMKFIAALVGVGLLALWWLSVAVAPLLKQRAARSEPANPA